MSDEVRLIPPPPAEAFAPWPHAWTMLGRSSALGVAPVGVDRFGRRVTVYRRRDGTLVAMDAKCWHLGSDLSAGTVENDCLRCPFHGWAFDADGRCVDVPAARGTPLPAARQATFAVAERAGVAFLYPSDVAPIEVPWFSGATPDELVGARPFEFTIACPWWMVGTNAFDLQHFAGAHDRRLDAEPIVTTPHPAARRIEATFTVCGDSWRDRLTRRLSGAQVTMRITTWAGSLVFVEAITRRRTTFGLTCIGPLPPAADGSPRARVTVHIFVPKRKVIGRADAAIRADFIRAFMRPDVQLLDEARYDPTRFIAADRVMADYLTWLAPVSRGPCVSDSGCPQKETS